MDDDTPYELGWSHYYTEHRLYEAGLEEIAAARKRYLAGYKRWWRKRKSRVEFSISFTREELATIDHFAIGQEMSRNAVIREATMQVVHKGEGLIRKDMGDCKALLTQIYTEVQRAAQLPNKGLLGRDPRYRELEAKVAELVAYFETGGADDY